MTNNVVTIASDAGSSRRIRQFSPLAFHVGVPEMKSFMRARHALVATLAVVSLVLTACGDDDETAEPKSDIPKVSADAALAAAVPAEFKEDGKLTIGTDPTYAPNEFLDNDGKTVIGFDVDLFNAVAAKLDLEAEFVASAFDDIIPGISSGKYEVGVSSFTINSERLQQVDMVSYFMAGTQWATRKGNPENINPDSACGKSIAVQRGTVQVDDIEARSKKCTDEGKEAIKIDPYQGQDEATAAVASGKNDAMLADSPIAAYAVKQSDGELAQLGDIYDSAPYGIALTKGHDEFAQAIADAFQQLIDEGVYQKVLEKWGVDSGSVDQSVVNPQL